MNGRSLTIFAIIIVIIFIFATVSRDTAGVPRTRETRDFRPDANIRSFSPAQFCNSQYGQYVNDGGVRYCVFSDGSILTDEYYHETISR